MAEFPEFIIIGAQKSGTTSMHKYLGEHPMIDMPELKEIHFFDLQYAKGEEWYLSHFKEEFHINGILQGEASPYYIFHPLVPERLKNFNSDMKLILLLREPVSRAISHYHHSVKHGLEKLSFEDAIRLEPERLKGEDLKMLKDPYYFSYSHQHHSYVSRGFYAIQISHWFSYFNPSQMLILGAEQFFEDSQSVINKVTDFLNVNSFEIKDKGIHNRGESDLVCTGMAAKLKVQYRKANEELFELIGQDLGWNST